jgi:hypothetical protein
LWEICCQNLYFTLHAPKQPEIKIKRCVYLLLLHSCVQITAQNNIRQKDLFWFMVLEVSVHHGGGGGREHGTSWQLESRERKCLALGLSSFSSFFPITPIINSL